VNLLGPIATMYLRRIERWLRRAAEDPVRAQQRVLERLVGRAAGTWFGRAHDLASVSSPADLARAVPIGDHAAWLPLIERMWQGEPDVSWPGRVRTFARTSGTTAGDKRIPVTRDLKRSNFRGGLAVFTGCERVERGLFTRILDGQLLLLGATVALDPTGHGGRVGHLSGISANWIPKIFRRWYEPGWAIARLKDWPQRIEATARRIAGVDLRFVTGIPSWTKVLFDRVCELRGLAPEGGLSEVWPNFLVYVHWGTNFDPYRSAFERYFRPGHKVIYLDSYSASEGFIATQVEAGAGGMDLFVENGLFFEFVPLEEWGKPGARRLWIGQVETGVPYCLLVSSNAGLWGYDFGDVVRFTSLKPPRIVFAGRHEEYMNAFGEHVVGEQISAAVAHAADSTAARVRAFTVGPRFPAAGRPLGGHEVVVEFERPPAAGLHEFAAAMDRALAAANNSYADKRRGNLGMTPPHVVPVPTGTFHAWLEERGRVGAQYKVPVCADDRRYVDELLKTAAARTAAS